MQSSEITVQGTSTSLMEKLRTRNRLFQIAGILACVAIYLASQQSSIDPAEQRMLTIRSQTLIQQLLDHLMMTLGWLSEAGLNAILFAAFALALLVVTRGASRPGLLVSVLVLLQMLLGLTVSNDLLLIVAAQLPLVFAFRAALFWLFLQSLGVALVWAYVLFFQELGAAEAWPQLQQVGRLLIQFFAWQLFAFFLGCLAMSERMSRDRLLLANSQLLATQQLLDESARSSERLRIARDLHDGLGHHLTALGLHLELAVRKAADAESASIRTAQSIARELLAEVRSAVGRERQSHSIDLDQSLRMLFAGVPVLQIDFTHEASSRYRDPALVHVIFRTIQEAISNTLRHADASCVSVRIVDTGKGMAVEFSDDGRGASQVMRGHGLQGMQERIEAIGGSLKITTLPGKGFHLQLFFPEQECS